MFFHQRNVRLAALQPAILILLALAFCPPALASLSREVRKTSVNSLNIASESFEEPGITLLATTLYPNGCYMPELQDVYFEPHTTKIVITNHAIVHNGFCHQAVLPSQVQFQLGVLPVGSYQIIDGKTGTRLVELVVKSRNNYQLIPID